MDASLSLECVWIQHHACRRGGGTAVATLPGGAPVDQSERKPLVLITGAAGLLGTAITNDLARDHRVVGLDRDAAEGEWNGADLVEVDLTDEADLDRALEAVRADHGSRVASAIHLAAYYDFSGAESPLYDALTVQGTRRLLARLRDDFETEQFVFTSTLLVMAPSEGGEMLREDSPTRADWAYPRSKLEAEEVIRSEGGDLRRVVLRIAGVYDDDGHSIPIAQQIVRIREKRLESVFFPGNPHHGQPFVHLADVVDLVRRVVERRAEPDPHEIFLVAEADLMSYGELQDRIGALLHDTEWPTLRIPGPIAKAGAWLKSKLGDGDDFIQPWMIDLADAHYPVSIERARRRLGWAPRHRLRESLAAIVRALEADPQGWYAAHHLEYDAAESRTR
jgi:nucleoside-diphosphate-sugar epimerase